MTPFEVKNALEKMVVLVDTREQDTPALHRRLIEIGCLYERQKLNFGDYSVKCQIAESKWFSLSSTVCIERKMSFDELCNCFCKGRGRFTREFERAKEANAKVYLLIENASWEKAFNGEYRSQMSAQAFVASITAWQARYNCQIEFCKAETSGKLIREILYRELKERLESG